MTVITKLCRECDGEGDHKVRPHHPDERLIPCAGCGGHGRVEDEEWAGYGDAVASIPVACSCGRIGLLAPPYEWFALIQSFQGTCACGSGRSVPLTQVEERMGI